MGELYDDLIFAYAVRHPEPLPAEKHLTDPERERRYGRIEGVYMASGGSLADMNRVLHEDVALCRMVVKCTSPQEGIDEPGEGA